MTDPDLDAALTTVRESIRAGFAAFRRIPASGWVFGEREIASLMFATKQEMGLAVQAAATRVDGRAAIVVQGVLLRGQPAYAVEWYNGLTGTEGATAQRVTYHPVTGVVFENAEPHPCPLELRRFVNP